MNEAQRVRKRQRGRLKADRGVCVYVYAVFMSQQGR